MALWVDREPWFEEALCRGLPAEIFHPYIEVDGEEVIDNGMAVGAGRVARHGHRRLDMAPFYAEAKAICAECPVSAECLAYAMRNHERFGCWGGTIPLDRWRIERRENRAALKAEREAAELQWIDDNVNTKRRKCEQCGGLLDAYLRSDARFCGERCRAIARNARIAS